MKSLILSLMIAGQVFGGLRYITPLKVVASGGGTVMPTDTKSASFNGTTSLLTNTTPTTVNFERTHAFSVCGWVKDTNTDGYAYIAFNLASASPNAGYYFFFGYNYAEGTLRGSAGGNANLYWTSSHGATTNAWTLGCMTYDGSSDISGVKYYIDNQLTTKSTVNNSLASSMTTSGPLVVGSRLTDAYTHNYLDQVSIWDIELSGSALADLRTSGTPHIPADLYQHSQFAHLVSWYFIGEGSDTVSTIVDRGSGGNNLTGTAITFVSDVP